MAWTAQWRTKGDWADSVLVLDDQGMVRGAIPANQMELSRLLTHMGDLETWRGDTPLSQDELSPEGWGELVISRGSSGEVLEVEPELFWHGIYLWFRSHGVDYDSPGLATSTPRDLGRPPRSALMDD